MGDLLNSIFGFLGDTVVAQLESFVIWLFNFVVVVFQVLFQLIFIVAQFFFKVFVAVGNFFQHLWTNFFKSIFQNVWNAIKAAQSWLESHLRPIINFLKRLRALQQIYFNTYIKPILDMLTRIRQFLQVLRLLHIQLAAQLDAALANVQAQIVQTFATAQAAINTLIGITSALMDPTYLIRRPALLLSIRRQVPALIHVLTGRPPGYWFPSPRGSAGGAFAPVSASFSFADTAQNPPTSSYIALSDGVPDSLPLDIGYTISVTAVDSAAPLDYFNNALYPQQLCSDGTGCWARVLARNLNVGT